MVLSHIFVSVLSITGTMRTGLEVLLNLPPLHIHIKIEAIAALLRVRTIDKILINGTWSQEKSHGISQV